MGTTYSTIVPGEGRGLGVGLAVGVGFAVGFAVGLALGLAVGLELGLGVANAMALGVVEAPAGEGDGLACVGPHAIAIRRRAKIRRRTTL